MGRLSGDDSMGPQCYNHPNPPPNSNRPAPSPPVRNPPSGPTPHPYPPPPHNYNGYPNFGRIGNSSYVHMGDCPAIWAASTASQHHQPGWHWWEIFISPFPFYESLFLKQLKQYLIPMPKTNTRPPGTGIQTESGLYIYIYRSLSSAVQLCLELILWCCQKFKQSVVSILHINEMITQQLSTCRMLCSFSFSNTLIILFVWSSPTHCGLTSIL